MRERGGRFRNVSPATTLRPSTRIRPTAQALSARWSGVSKPIGRNGRWNGGGGASDFRRGDGISVRVVADNAATDILPRTGTGGARRSQMWNRRADAAPVLPDALLL